MSNRLEQLRYIIDRLIIDKKPYQMRYFITHLYSVSYFCTLLALRRGLNPDLASASGMLHDIYQITANTTENHALHGAEKAKKILKSIKLYTDEEIEIITTAVKYHSKKRKMHTPYAELLKDADVLSHSLYNVRYGVIEKDAQRYKNLMVELGCADETSIHCFAD